jgi:hypothetical protein
MKNFAPPEICVSISKQSWTIISYPQNIMGHSLPCEMVPRGTVLEFPSTHFQHIPFQYILEKCHHNLSGKVSS